MEYNIIEYKTNEDNSARFILSNKKKNPLIVIGLNPSTADEKSPDRTINKVMGFAEGNKYDSFIMLNLYPQRATNPDNLHENINQDYLQQNISEIQKLLNGFDEINILASWSDKISSRNYFTTCIKSIYNSISEKAINWKKIGELTKKGNPRHPLYSSYNLPLTEFDIKSYIQKLK